MKRTDVRLNREEEQRNKSHLFQPKPKVLPACSGKIKSRTKKVFNDPLLAKKNRELTGHAVVRDVFATLPTTDV